MVVDQAGGAGALHRRRRDEHRHGNYVPFAPNGFTGIHQGAAIVFFPTSGLMQFRWPLRRRRIRSEICRLASSAGWASAPSSMWSSARFSPDSCRISNSVWRIRWRCVERRRIPARRVDRGAGCGGLDDGGAAGVSMRPAEIFFSMARDGLLPKAMARIDQKKVPYMTTLITGVVVAVLSMVGDAAETYDLTNIGTLFAFALVCGGVLILRVKEPDRPRPFKVPFVWVLAPAGVAACLFVMKGLPVQAWERFGIWLAIGLVIYFAYSIATAISGTRPDSRLTSGWRAGPRFIEAAAGRVRDAHARRAGRGHHQGGRPCGRRSDPPVAAIHQPARRLCVAACMTCSSIAASAAWFSTFAIRRRRFWNRCCRKWMWSLRASARPRRSDWVCPAPAARAPSSTHSCRADGVRPDRALCRAPGTRPELCGGLRSACRRSARPAHLPGMFIADVGGGDDRCGGGAGRALRPRAIRRGRDVGLSMHDAALYWVMLPGARDLIDGGAGASVNCPHSVTTLATTSTRHATADRWPWVRSNQVLDDVLRRHRARRSCARQLTDPADQADVMREVRGCFEAGPKPSGWHSSRDAMCACRR